MSVRGSYIKFQSSGGGTTTLSTAKLMKTGQTVSYRTGDDGDIQSGRNIDFFRLPENNPFGNTNRFTDELGGQKYSNNIVIDWSTYEVSSGEVLGYSRKNNKSGLTWDDAIEQALAFSVGSFTSGWRLPNIREIQNLFLWDVSQLINTASQFSYDPFYTTFVNTATFWSSTTLPAATGFAMVSNAAHRIDYVDKTTAERFLFFPVRTFTVSGTTLS